MIGNAIDLLETVFKNSNVDSGHSLGHSLQVLHHSQKVLEEFDLSDKQKTCVELASLLHDADDKKFFPNNKNDENTRSILDKLKVEKSEVDLIIKIISLVSYRSNKNTETEEKWMYITRFCDRLEAIGKIGIERSYSCTIFFGHPLFLESTKRATTLEELYRIASKERQEKFDGNSASMIDHFYDKILHIGEPILKFGSKYMSELAKQRIKEIEDYCLHFGRHGTLPSVDNLSF